MIVKAPSTHTYGPADHGRPMSLERFLAGPWLEGYRYELIDGRVYVSPQPNLPHEDAVDWLNDFLRAYMKANPGVINKVSLRSRVFVPGRPDTTCPEPDLAAYHAYPYHLPRHERRWEDVNPVLVVAVVSDDIAKDLGRNVSLYEQVPSIREYWAVLDSDATEQFLFRVYRKRGAKWQKPIDLRLGDTYTTRLLPGFSLLVNPDAG